MRRLVFLLALLACLTASAATATARGTDANRNRLPDRWERSHALSVKTDLSRRDSDRDGLTNRSEYRKRTNPRRRDTDRDGLLDGRDPQPRVPARRGSRAATPTTSVAPAGTPPLSDAAAAARVRRSPFEPRPENATATRTVPTAAQLRTFLAESNDWGRCNPLKARVTGSFTGTTDEIIQWAAQKWGVGEDLVRAAAVTESFWRASTVGDGGRSFGLMQIKSTASPGTFPMSRDSVAFNVDYYAATLRYYVDGCATWLGSGYAGGDVWGAIGAWYSGDWHDADSEEYIAKVRAGVGQRRWEQTGF
jgi:hypothetical protein